MYLVLIPADGIFNLPGYNARFLETREDVYKLINNFKVTKVFNLN